jgi:hypothetical protein
VAPWRDNMNWSAFFTGAPEGFQQGMKSQQEAMHTQRMNPMLQQQQQMQNQQSQAMNPLLQAHQSLQNQQLGQNISQGGQNFAREGNMFDAYAKAAAQGGPNAVFGGPLAFMPSHSSGTFSPYFGGQGPAGWSRGPQAQQSQGSGQGGFGSAGQPQGAGGYMGQPPQNPFANAQPYYGQPQSYNPGNGGWG